MTGKRFLERHIGVKCENFIFYTFILSLFNAFFVIFVWNLLILCYHDVLGTRNQMSGFCGSK